LLVGAVNAALFEELVDERSFAVVDVGDDSDISDVLVHGAEAFWSLEKGRTCGSPEVKARPKAVRRGNGTSPGK
jgi:hypothetical protein